MRFAGNDVNAAQKGASIGCVQKRTQTKHMPRSHIAFELNVRSPFVFHSARISSGGRCHGDDDDVSAACCCCWPLFEQRRALNAPSNKTINFFPSSAVAAALAT